MPNCLDQLASKSLSVAARKSSNHITAKITVAEDRTLIVQIPVDIFHLLCAWRGNSYKAAAWLQARIMEVANLSLEAVTHYLNLMIRQQIPLSELVQGKADPSNLPRIKIYPSLLRQLCRGLHCFYRIRIRHGLHNCLRVTRMDKCNHGSSSHMTKHPSRRDSTRSLRAEGSAMGLSAH